MPLVSIIIPHYEDLESLTRCLAALQAQTYPLAECDIVVADNNSNLAIEAIEQVIDGVARLVVVEARGAGPARNGGVAAARGEILAFTDADCIPDPDWLAEGVKALAGYDLVGGRMSVLVRDPHGMTGAEAFERVFAFDAERYVREKGFAVTANLFCSRTTFERVGGFRVGISEDLEWCHRARRMGLRLGYAPNAVVAHPARHSWEELQAKWRRLNAETYHLYRERGRGDVRWFLRNLAVPLSAFAHMPKVLLSDQLITFGQRVLAAVTLFRLRFWRCGDALRLITSTKDT